MVLSLFRVGFSGGSIWTASVRLQAPGLSSAWSTTLQPSESRQAGSIGARLIRRTA